MERSSFDAKSGRCSSGAVGVFMTGYWWVHRDGSVCANMFPVSLSPKDLNRMFLADFGDDVGDGDDVVIGPAVGPCSDLVVPAWIGRANGQLAWREHTREEDAKALAPPAGLLEAFAGLSDESDDAIVAFAARFGPLRLCAIHRRPHGVEGEVRCPPEIVDGDSEPWPASDALRVESFDLWRTYAAKVRALLQVGAALRIGEAPASDQLFSALGNPTGVSSDIANVLAAGSLDEQRANFAMAMQVLLHFAGPTLRPEWPQGSERMTYSAAAPGLFGVVVLQLLLTMASTKHPAVCSECGDTFAPKRTPQSGRLSWCDKPGCKKASRNAASAAYRQRQRNTQKRENR